MTTAEVAYKECNQNEHLLALRERATSAYTSPGTVQIPRYFSLVLPVSATKLLADSGGGALLAWAQSQRSAREKYFDYLMDFATQCESTTRVDSVCRIRDIATGVIDVFNPWTGGDFSDIGGCDISETTERSKPARVFDTRCTNIHDCPTQDDVPAFYAHQVSGCRVKNDEWVPGRTVPTWMRSNICFLQPSVATGPNPNACNHAQGILGGGATPGGAGAVQPTLYSSTEPPNTRETGGLFVRPHRELFRTPAFIAADVGIEKSWLHLHRDDIGGHQMHFVVSKEGVLRLYDLVLAGSSQGGAAACTAEHLEKKRNRRAATDGSDMHSWLIWDTVLEHSIATHQEPDIVEDGSRPIHWTCPLKQRLYLSGQAGPAFRPSLPNARRAATIISLHNRDNGDVSSKRSSTVQAPNSTRTFVRAPSIKTSNGFCYCASLQECQVPLGSGETCGLADTVDALRNDASGWHFSKVRKGTLLTACKEHLDWPYTDGQLRDSSFIGGPAHTTPRETDCNLLDRIHDFQYRYRKEPASTGAGAKRNTQIPGGDCYTGAAKRMGGGRAYTWTPGERRSCHSSCSPPPAFTANVRGQDTEIPAESSFGVLYRESAERAIAGNLREKLRNSLCAGSANTGTSCNQLDRIVNVSSWVPEKFWGVFLDDVSALFTRNTTMHTDTGVTQSMSARDLLLQAGEAFETTITSDEAAMWTVPWVYCNRVDPVCSYVFDDETQQSNRVCSTGSTVGNCTNVITHENWVNPHTRIPSCRSALLDVASKAGFEAVAPINICDMDTVMNSLCVAIQAARNRLFEINCRIAGVCHDERFFYVPGIYSAANQEFVQATVENFYLATSSESCPIVDDRNKKLHESNSLSVKQCASTQLQIVYEMLGGLRVIVDKLMRIVYFYFMVQINLMRFVFEPPAPADGSADNSESHAWGQVLKYWELLVREMGQLFESIGNLVYNIMMDSGFGRSLQTFLDRICEIVQMIMDELWLAFICPEILFNLGNLLSTFNIAQWYPFKDIGDSFLYTHSTSCKPGTKLCSSITLPMADPDPTSLPVSTRCWSTYSTFLGDAASLSCSAADTCMAGDISALHGETSAYSQTAGMQICDSCALPPSTSFARYGCDIVTKTCKCGVQSLLRTTCVANDECALPGMTCDIVDDFFERDVFGSISCAECASDRICLVAPGDSVGHCGCATREVSYATCEPQARGEIVFTRAFSMCMVAIGTAAQSELRSTNSYNIQGSKLATARCDMLDASQRYCISVELSPGVSPTFAVGLESIGSRRLLSFIDSNSTASAFFRFVVPPEAYERALASNWSTVHTLVCRHVPKLVDSTVAGATPLSLADQEMLSACVRWRAIGMEVLHVANISHLIPETFLIGPEDFAYDVVMHPARFYAVLRRPWLFVRAALQTRYMTPVRVLLRDVHRWWVHANIEAFSSANELETVLQDAQAWAANSNNKGNRNSTRTALDSIDRFTNGMSRHLTTSVWRYLFSNRKPVSSKRYKSDRNTRSSDKKSHETHRRSTEQRRQTHHEMALGHAILHTPAVRAHWVPEESGAKTWKRAPHTLHVQTNADKNDASKAPKRSLLQFVDTAFVERVNAVQAYSSSVALGAGVVQILPATVADKFVKVDMPWPPTYV